MISQLSQERHAQVCVVPCRQTDRQMYLPSKWAGSLWVMVPFQVFHSKDDAGVDGADDDDVQNQAVLTFCMLLLLLQQYRSEHRNHHPLQLWRLLLHNSSHPHQLLLPLLHHPALFHHPLL